MIGGVAGGLAAYFGIDPAIVRVAFVLLAFAGGSGILAYLVLWLVVPEAESAELMEAHPAGGRGNLTTWAGVGLLVVGGLLLLDNIGRFGRVVWPLVLVVIGGALLANGTRGGDEGDPGGDEPTSAPPRDTRPASALTRERPPAPAEERSTARTAAPAALRRARPPRPPRRRSPLGQVTTGLALLVVGGLALLDSTGIYEPTAQQYLAAAVVVLGIGLLIGTWWGRARWLLVLGVILLPFLVVLSTVDLGVRGPMGDLSYRPETVAEVRDSYDIGAGTLRVDLRDLDFPQEPVEIDLNAGAGEVVVIVPDDVALDVEARVGAGDIHIGNQNWGGFGVKASQSFEGTRGRLALDLDVGLGTIEVRRVPRA